MMALKCFGTMNSAASAMSNLIIDCLYEISDCLPQVGYGDVTPLTHFGRIVAALMSISGSVMVALLIASLSNALQWSAEERMAVNLCQRERTRKALLHKATTLVQLWWRRRMRRKRGQKEEKHTADVWRIRKEFSKAREITRTEMEDMASNAEKVNQIHRRVICTNTILNSLADQLWSYGVYSQSFIWCR